MSNCSGREGGVNAPSEGMEQDPVLLAPPSDVEELESNVREKRKELMQLVQKERLLTKKEVRHSRWKTRGIQSVPEMHLSKSHIRTL